MITKLVSINDKKHVIATSAPSLLYINGDTEVVYEKGSKLQCCKMRVDPTSDYLIAVFKDNTLDIF